MSNDFALNDIRFNFSVDAPPDTIFPLWSSEAGIKSFLSPNARIDPVLGGDFEIYFDPDAPAGSRGSEGCQYLAIVPDEMVSFSWNSPPTLPRIRAQRTMIRILFEACREGTAIQFDHVGMGLGEDWRKNREYFTRAWGDIVLPRFKFVAEGGAVDWQQGVELPGLRPVPS